ncbi:MAG: AraC family transcriptional regulator [Muribaculaceae bacterium]|nr:AraC family transcriptional regulator [Muribaculaceae bacterium]
MISLSSDICQLLFYSANLVFIVTHLYGWLLKWFYRPTAYNDNFEELFPAYREVGMLYLMQVMELPYLLQVGNHDALLYVNAFAVLFYSLQMQMMCGGYFFPSAKRKRRDYLIYLPAVVVLLPLLMQAVGLVSLPEGHRPWTFTAVTIIFAAYFALSVRMALKIGRTMQQVNEASYADQADFPVRLAQYLQWVPTCVCVIMAVNFYADSSVVKALRDVLFTVVSIWFCIFTLNPRRKVFTPQEQEIIEQIEELEEVEQAETPAYRLSDDRYDELSQSLKELLIDKQIFTEPHITIDTIMQRMGTNANYLAEVIRRNGYRSFYDMVCLHRVRHAITLIQQNPDEKLLIIADQCGFSSPSSMAKAFKQQGQPSPSSFRKKR